MAAAIFRFQGLPRHPMVGFMHSGIGRLSLLVIETGRFSRGAVA